MSKINVLDSSIFNRISAGEVVERPRSVVKELVENSIDAGANSIVIEIKNGGISYIRVIDNGFGIMSEDVEKAFLPHATSKIKTADDLAAIGTLGFRGEALASIAAVAKVTMKTRVDGTELGDTITIDCGEIIDRGQCGRPIGTSVIVEQIFKNIPARAKFLSKPASEENEITTLVGKLILANPRISFKYTVDGKIVYYAPGDGMESAIETVYGAGILDKSMKISLSMPDINISGYVNKPAYSRHNRSYQTLIVNGRYVTSEDISRAVFLAYKDLLMTRQYPVYVIYLDIPLDMIDVNVHPSKMQVKFADSARIYKLLSTTISKALYDVVNEVKEIKILQTEDKFPKYQKVESKDGMVTTLSVNNSFSQTKMREKPMREILQTYSHADENKPNKANLSSLSSVRTQVLSHDTNFVSNKEYAEKLLVEKDKKEQQKMDMTNSTKIVGKLFNTYIIVESGESTYLIDQHAAHERILYDKMITDINTGEIMKQDLLLPYNFTLSYSESQLLDTNISLLESMGFEISKLSGTSYSMNALPVILSEMRENEFLAVLFDILSSKRANASDFLKESIMQAACKSAVKGNMDLSETEITDLLSAMQATEVMFCPHGRPIVIKITKSEIEKWFKRIV